MAHLENIPCGCNGRSHCPKCGGSGRSENYLVHHPVCGQSGCKGTMFPTDHRPGSRLRCSKCGRIAHVNIF